MENLAEKINHILSTNTSEQIVNILPYIQNVRQAFTDLSESADMYKLAAGLKGIVREDNAEKCAKKLSNYAINDERAFFLSNAFRKILLSNSLFVSNLIGVMIGELTETSRGLTQPDWVIFSTMERLTDYDIRSFYELMCGRYTHGSDWIDVFKTESFPRGRTAEFQNTINLFTFHRIFIQHNGLKRGKTVYPEVKYSKSPMAYQLLKYIQISKELLEYEM